MSGTRKDDPFDLARFVSAQDRLEAGVPIIERAIQELRNGEKRSHWMWFVFPQLRGLGHSAAAQEFGITSLAEACAYLSHPILGARLLECCGLLLPLPRSAEEILGFPDHLKLRSSMTLFAAAASEVESHPNIFEELLNKFFGGERDDRTLAMFARR